MINRERLVELFAQYDALKGKVEEAKLAHEAAAKNLSNTTAAILVENEGKKKIRRGGKELSIVVRGSTTFIRGAKEDKDDVIDI